MDKLFDPYLRESLPLNTRPRAQKGKPRMRSDLPFSPTIQEQSV